jgi:lipopolysaccharide biosynthesis glycosyltransferase
MTITTYDKLTIGRWPPASVGRALWLDCDLMVLADLTRLWDKVQGRHTILAAQDTMVPTLGARFGVACHQEPAIDAQAAYFNAGVMLIDLERWRSEDVAGRALAYLKRNRRRVFFWDQEALNRVLVGEWSRLDPRWNWSPRFEGSASPDSGLDGTRHPPWIVHFSGNLKPWCFEGRSTLHRLYYQYLDSTAWDGWRPAHSWRNLAVSAYESSRFRRVMYPLERLAMTIGRTTTLHYVSADPN